MARRRIVILGAGGRDFHNFNTCFRDNPGYEVVCFTATQIPHIENRTYPAEIAGKLYPNGIPILPEQELPNILKNEKLDEAIFAYSDVSHEQVMHVASTVMAAGCDFRILGPKATMIKGKVPIVAVLAVRTGAGKSPATRKITKLLRDKGKKVVVIRHPMPYGDLRKQAVQRFEKMEDLVLHDCTVEEREEYEPHLENGMILYAGVDYEQIIRAAEKEADVVVWDGGNNDMSFYEPNLSIVIADAHRPDHGLKYHPGETNMRLADVIVVNKEDTATPENIKAVKDTIALLNPRAEVIDAACPISVDKPELIRGKRVLVIEDGPTLTHGGMTFGAGVVAARKFGAKELIDPRPFAVGEIKESFVKYPAVGPLLPALGYGARQVSELETTIRASNPEVVIIATPADLRRIIKIDRPVARVRYELEELGPPKLDKILSRIF